MSKISGSNQRIEGENWKEEQMHSGGTLNLWGLEDEVQALLQIQGRRYGGSAQVGLRSPTPCVSGVRRKRARRGGQIRQQPKCGVRLFGGTSQERFHEEYQVEEDGFLEARGPDMRYDDHHLCLWVPLFKTSCGGWQPTVAKDGRMAAWVFGGAERLGKSYDWRATDWWSITRCKSRWFSQRMEHQMESVTIWFERWKSRTWRRRTSQG